MLFLRKANSFALALWSWLRHGTVQAGAYRLRALECFGCEARIERGRRMYCGACGCPQWWLSDLRNKWRMRELKCPLGKW